MDDKLTLTVQDRESILYNGEIKNLTSVNDKGRFDVLNYHANFISLIKDYLLIRQPDGSEKELKFDFGLMKIKNNKITVLLGVKHTGE